MKKIADARKLTLKLQTMKILRGDDLKLVEGGSQGAISFGHKPGQCVPDGG